MTRDEILAMEPGRELDALVAEHVMGLEIIVNPKSAMCTGCKIKGQGTWVVIARDYHEWGHKVERPSRYSADIAAAWQVVEKMMTWKAQWMSENDLCDDQSVMWSFRTGYRPLN